MNVCKKHAARRAALKIAAIVALAIVLSMTASCKGKTETSTEEQLMVVEVISPSREVVSETVSLSGTIKAERRSMVAAGLGGKVTAIFADVGDEVKKGQVLMRLDAEPLAAQREQAQNMLKSAKLQLEIAGKGARKEDVAKIREQLAAAKTAFDAAEDNHQRLQKLFKDGVIPQSQIDQALALRDAAKAAYETTKLSLEIAQTGARPEDLEIARSSVAAAESQVKSLSATLSHATIAAPFDGVINARMFDLGEFAGMGDPVMEVIGTGSRKVEIDVPAPLVMQVAQAGEISLRLGGKAIPAMILKVHPAVNVMTRMGKIEVVPTENVEMIVGGFAEASFTTALTEETLTLPRKCVLSPDKDPYVWITSSGTVEMKPVTLGAASREKYEIKSGLTGEEKVLISGQTLVAEGGKYEVREYNGAGK
jgi:HlyD family secretion protein